MEIGKGLLGVFPHGIVQQHEGQRDRIGDPPAVGTGAAGGKEQHPAAVGHGLFGPGPIGGVVLLAQDEFRRTQDIGVLGTVGHGAVFGLGGEAQHLLGLAGVVRVQGVLKGLHGLVVRGHVGHEVRQLAGQGLLVGVVGQGDQPLIDHLRLGDGARLVHAQHVHPGQSLGAFQVLHQGVFGGGQPQHAGCQGQADHEVQSFRDHADDGGGSALDPFLDGQAQQGGLAVEEQPPDGDDEDADGDEQPVQGAHHPRQMTFLGFLGFAGELGRVGVRPHPGEDGVALAGDHEAAREQLAAHPLGDLVRLAGEQGFIDLDRAGDYLGVGADLVAGGEEDQVIPDQIPGVDAA